MTVAEQKFMETLPHYVAELVKQLKIANQLKALELTGRKDLGITPEMVDDALDS